MFKRLKGEETNEAKTELNFEVFDNVMGETTSLNGLTRTQTDANIRKHFGTLDDFSVSSIVPSTARRPYLLLTKAQRGVRRLLPSS